MKIALVSQADDCLWRRHTELYENDCLHMEEIGHILERRGIPVSTWTSVGSYLANRQRNESSDELVFSLVENCFERNRPALIPALWELLGITYVGNDAYAFSITSDKMLFQGICQHLGLKCPRSFEIRRDMPAGIIQSIILERNLSYPLVMKYRYGTMSHGLTLVNDLEMLLSEAKHLLDEEPDSSVLCQEYILGMEATVPIVGTGPAAHALALIQYTGPGHEQLILYDKDWKYTLDDLVELVPFPWSDSFTQKTVQDCLKLHRYFGLQDMSRFDLRITESREGYILEANCIPSLGYGGAFDPASYGGKESFDDIIIEIIHSAWSRKRRGIADAIK